MTNVRNIAYDFIAKQEEIKTLPLKLNELLQVTEKYDWEVVRYSQAIPYIEALKEHKIDLTEYLKQNDGFAISFENNIFIFYKNGLSTHRTLFVICHEIGHIVLNHITSGIVLGISDNENTTAAQELEANEFALEMMAPLPVLTHLKLQSYADITELGFLPADNAQQQYRKLSVFTNNGITARNETELYITKKFKKTIQFRQKEIFKYTTKKRICKITAAICLLLILAGGIYIGLIIPRNEKHIQTVPVDETEILSTHTEYVYVTSGGEKYHKQDCVHISGRNPQPIPIEKAKQNYFPCKSCKPDKEQ